MYPAAVIARRVRSMSPAPGRRPVPWFSVSGTWCTNLPSRAHSWAWIVVWTINACHPLSTSFDGRRAWWCGRAQAATKAKGWWHSYGDVIPERFDVFIGLEEAASRIDWYETELVPGLLQTERYARAIIGTDNAHEAEEEITRRVNLRIARQALLTRRSAPATLRIALNEAVVRRPVGGKELMAEQLRSMVHASRLPNVTLRVVPFSAGLHRGVMTGQFGVLRFPRTGDGTETEPPTVYADGFTGDLYLDKPEEVARYDVAFDDIWHRSLSEEATRRLLLEVAEQYGDH